MNVRTFALICGTVGVAFTSAIVACSSSSSGGGGGNEDAGSSSSGSSSGTTSSSSGSSSGTTSSSSSSSSSGSSSGSTCEDPKLHPETTAGTIFCGYPADGGASFSCTTGNECCLGGTAGTGYAADECAAFGTACSNGTGPISISCNQIADCTANGIQNAACCLQGTTSPPAAIAGCDAADLKLSGGTAVVCEASDAGAGDVDGGDASASGGGSAPSCATGEIQICAVAADCPAGKTCTPMHWKTYQVGFCM